MFIIKVTANQIKYYEKISTSFISRYYHLLDCEFVSNYFDVGRDLALLDIFSLDEYTIHGISLNKLLYSKY